MGKEVKRQDNRVWPPDDQTLLDLYKEYRSIRKLIEAFGWPVWPSTVQRRLAAIPGYDPEAGSVIETSQIYAWHYDDGMSYAEIRDRLAAMGEKITRSGVCKRVKRYESKLNKEQR